MQTLARSTVGSLVFLVVLSIGTLFFRLGALPLSGADEPRYARIAEEMRLEGRWVTPLLQGRPWLEKPPLYYWSTIPFYAVLGAGETAARLSPAFFSLLAAFAIFWLGARLWSRLAGLIGASILLTSIGFAGFARSASTDMPMTGCLTAAMALFAAAVGDPKFPRHAVWPGYVLLGLAVLAKGPVAIVMALGSGILFWCFDERGESLSKWMPGRGMVVCAAVALPWFWLAFRENGFSFVSMLLINHNLARYVTDIHHHSQPFYYYIPVLAGLLFPWTGWVALLWPGSLREQWSRRREWHPAALFMICWVAFPLLFFSVSEAKLAGYILPVLPPLALMIGVRMAQAAPDLSGTAARWLYITVTAALAIAAPIAFGKIYADRNSGFLLAAAILCVAPVSFYYSRRRDWNATALATAAQGFLMVVAVTLFAYPALGRSLSTRDIARQALAQRKENEPIVTYRFFQHSLLYYSGYRISGELQSPDSLKSYVASHPSFLMVADARTLTEIRSVPGIAVTQLAEQPKVRLLRILRGAHSDDAIAR